MITLGAAFVVFACLMQFFGMTVITAAFVTGIGLILLGLIMGGGVHWHRP